MYGQTYFLIVGYEFFKIYAEWEKEVYIGYLQISSKDMLVNWQNIVAIYI